MKIIPTTLMNLFLIYTSVNIRKSGLVTFWEYLWLKTLWNLFFSFLIG